MVNAASTEDNPNIRGFLEDHGLLHEGKSSRVNIARGTRTTFSSALLALQLARDIINKLFR